MIDINLGKKSGEELTIIFFKDVLGWTKDEEYYDTYERTWAPPTWTSPDKEHVNERLPSIHNDFKECLSFVLPELAKRNFKMDLNFYEEEEGSFACRTWVCSNDIVDGKPRSSFQGSGMLSKGGAMSPELGILRAILKMIQNEPLAGKRLG